MPRNLASDFKDRGFSSWQMTPTEVVDRSLAELMTLGLRVGDNVATDIFDYMIPLCREAELSEHIIKIVIEFASVTGLLLIEDGYGLFFVQDATVSEGHSTIQYMRKLLENISSTTN